MATFGCAYPLGLESDWLAVRAAQHIEACKNKQIPHPVQKANAFRNDRKAPASEGGRYKRR